MHNGVVAGFMQIRRRLLAELSDAAYNAVQSFHSDSAVRWGHRPGPGQRGKAEDGEVAARREGTSARLLVGLAQ